MPIDKRQRTKPTVTRTPPKKSRPVRSATVVSQDGPSRKRRASSKEPTKINRKPQAYYKIMCYGDVMPEMAGAVRQELAEAQHVIAEAGAELAELHVYIDSPGGMLDAGLDIYDQLLAVPAKIVTHVYGQAASAAMLIFAAGDQRLIAPNATLMLHNGSVEIGGSLSAEELRRAVIYIESGQKSYNALLAGRCGVELTVVDGWCNAETRFTAAEAVAAKLADGIEATVDRAKYRG